MRKQRVAIIEDEVIYAEYLSELCRLYGAQVVGMAHDARAAQKLIFETQPDIALMDLKLLDDKDGADVAREIGILLPNLKVVFVTGASDPQSLARIRTTRPHDVLSKPVHPEEIQRVMQ